jgi:hypothetical protein
VVFFDFLLKEPGAALLTLLEQIIVSLSSSSLTAWGEITNLQGWFEGKSPLKFLPIGLSMLVGLLVWVFFRYILNSQDEKSPFPQAQWSRQAFILGGLAMLVGGIPFWLTDLPIRLSFPWDRFTLVMIFGVSLVLAAILVYLVRQRESLILVVSLLTALSVNLHFANALEYERFRSSEQDFFWQLVWRAPSIRPGTLLLTSAWPFERSTDNSLTAPLNWTYAPELDSARLPYLMQDIPTRLGISLPALAENLPVVENYRAYTFEGSTSQALVFYYEPPSCLRIIDPEIDEVINRYPQELHEAIPLSNPGLIEVNRENPARPPFVFGAEPAPDWCYYYSKAELANQLGDYPLAASLGDTAQEAGFSPRDPYEYLPFIKANALSGHWTKAVNMTHNALEGSYRTQEALCRLWSQIDEQAPESGDKQAALQQVEARLDCSP